MKITYTGRHIELSPAQAKQLEEEFGKVAKILDNGFGQAEAHVVLSHANHTNHAEVTVPYHHHELKSQATHADLFAALHEAVGKLEAQAVRVKDKWREGRKAPKPGADELGAGQ